jgi:hypothetical protein
MGNGADRRDCTDPYSHPQSDTWNNADRHSCLKRDTHTRPDTQTHGNLNAEANGNVETGCHPDADRNQRIAHSRAEC